MDNIELQRNIGRALEKCPTVRVPWRDVCKCLPPVGFDVDDALMNISLTLAGCRPVGRETTAKRFEEICRWNKWEFHRDITNEDFIVSKKLLDKL